jgi:hypothetical protein
MKSQARWYAGQTSVWEGNPVFTETLSFLRNNWLQIAMVILSLVIGGNLAQQFTVLRQKTLAGKLARFSLAMLFSIFYYCLLYYLSVIFR